MKRNVEAENLNRKL